MTRTAIITNCTLGTLGLTLLLACGGGSSGGGSTTPTAATTLTYTNPTTGTYKLVRDDASTASHLVLNLVGPEGVTLSGVGFIVKADAAKVSWAVMNEPERISTAFFSTPLVAKSLVTGDELQAGVYQKGLTAAVVTEAASALATVALDLKSGLTPGTAVSFTATANKAEILNAPGATPATTPITISVGTLVAN